VNGDQAVPLSQPSQTFQNGFLGVMPPVGNRSLCFYECLLAGLALITLRTFAGPTEFADIAVINFAVFWTIPVPTERTGQNQPSVFHCPPNYVFVEYIILLRKGMLMMKAHLFAIMMRVVLALLVISGLASLSAASAGAQGGQAEWTVLSYYAADNNLEAEEMRDLTEVEIIGSSDKVNFVAIADRHPAYWTGSENWIGARYYRLEQDNNLFYIASPVAEELGDVNTGAPETLQQFIEWGVKNYPARHYALIINDHGGGWRGAASDETSDHAMLGLADLDRVLAGTLKSTGLDKFDLIVFDACLMGELEVWSVLAPYADYGVASEETTFGLKGLTEALMELVKNPTMSAMDLGKMLVDNFDEYYSQIGGGATLTMSEVDLNRMEGLQAAMDKLAIVLEKDMTTAETVLAVARGRAHSPAFAGENRDSYDTIDLRSFLLIVENLSETPEVVAAARQARDALGDAVVTYYAGEDVPSVGGLSFFFSVEPQLVDTYGDSLKPIPGAKDSPWIKFLKTYYARIPQAVEKPTVSRLKLARDTIATGEPAEIEAAVGGVGLQEISLVVGRVEGDALIAVDSNRIVLDEKEIVPGLKIPLWAPQDNEVAVSWDGVGWALSNGRRQVRAWVQASAPGSDKFAVPGYIHSVGGGTDLEGQLMFAVDLETGDSYYLGAFAQKEPGVMGPYTFEPGDAFIVNRQLISLKDGSVKEEKGGTLIIGETPPELLPSPVSNGTYAIGVRAVNLADEGTMELARVKVSNPRELAEYSEQSLSVATRPPSDWLVREEPGLITFTPDELSSVVAQIAVIYLEEVDIDLDRALKNLLDSMAENEGVSNITPGSYSDAQLAGYDARRLDYTFDLEGRGEVTGSMVAFVDYPRRRLYVLLSEAPSESMKDEQEGLDLVRNNMRLLPRVITQRDNSYTNQVMGFNLTHRSYWQVVERPAGNAVLFVTSSFDGVLGVQQRPGKRQPTASYNDVLIKLYLDENLIREDAFRAGNPANVTISGLKGRQVEYELRSEGKLFNGTVTAVTTRDGRGYILNAEMDTTSSRLDTLVRDLNEMQSSFAIFDPEASPVPNPGEGWKVYENEELHFGMAYQEGLEIKEDLSDPNFQAVSFISDEQRTIAIDVANIPLSPETAPNAETADKLAEAFIEEKVRESLKDVKVGTLEDMELAGIPARWVNYGGYAEVKIEGEPVELEMEGVVLVAPTPYGFAYLVNVILPTESTGGGRVDVRYIPSLLGTFTPFLQGLQPVSKVGIGGQELQTCDNAEIGLSITVPAAWRVGKEPHKVTFSATDEVGRAVEGYSLAVQDWGKQEALSPRELDEDLGSLLSSLEVESRSVETIAEPADATLGGWQGRSLEFIALTQGMELVDYTCIVVQGETGRLYWVVAAIPLKMLKEQEETMQLVLESIRFAR
jgi:hypothetical protein